MKRRAPLLIAEIGEAMRTIRRPTVTRIALLKYTNVYPAPRRDELQNRPSSCYGFWRSVGF